MTAMITAAVVATAGSAVMANQAEKAGQAATTRILNAEEKALAEQTRQYEQTRDDWAPWRDAGTNALAQLDDPEANFQKSPGYQFRLDEGTRNTENAFSVKGGGGNAMRALVDYSQNYASNDYGNWYDRQLGRAGLGTQGTAYTTQAGMNAANQNTNSIWRSGVNQASIGLYGANQQASHMADAWGSLIGGIKGYAGRNKSIDEIEDPNSLNGFKWSG